MDIQSNVANNIKKYRKEQGLSQEAFAEKLRVTSQAVSKWENGASDPSTSNLLALAKLYNISAEELLQQAQQ